MIATYETSRFDDFFSPREGFGLASLGAAGVSAQRGLLNAYLRNKADPRFPSLRETGLLALSGAYLYVACKEGAEASLTLVGEIEHASPELEYIETETSYPGIVWHKHGKGRTAYFPWDVERLAQQYGLKDHNRLMEETVRHLVGEDLMVEHATNLERHRKTA